MRLFDSIDKRLVTSRRPDEQRSPFVDHVMTLIQQRAINNRVLRTTSEQLNKETFIMKLRKLPISVILLAALAASIGIGGISYAAVKLIEANRPEIDKSRVNDNGKTQFSVKNDLCQQLSRNRGVRYELKEGIELPPREAVKYINAHCHLLLIDEQLKLKGSGFADGIVTGIIKDKGDGSTTVDLGGASLTPLDSSVSFYDQDLSKAGASQFKVGDKVLAYRELFNPGSGSPITMMMRPIEALKYYDSSQQQNIREVKECENNTRMDCTIQSNTNAVELIVNRGGSLLPANASSKEIQGRLVAYDAQSFTLENNGHRITFETPYGVIERYNQTTVYGLAQFDTVYANTDPELLKIAIGDSMSLYYEVSADEAAVPWVKVGVIALMVERTPSDISVLRKY